MTDSQELELSLDTGDGGDVCENAGTSDETQLCKSPVKFGVTKKKKKGIRKVGQRIRDPFNKKKIKELKRHKAALEAAVERLSQQMLIMISNHPRGENIISSVGNLQIDCTNNIHTSVSDLGEMQETIDRLTDAANRLLEELTIENANRMKENSELQLCLKRSEAKLDELKDLVLQCSSGIRQQETCHVQALKDLQDLQEALVTNMSDEQLVSDGISAIRLGIIFDNEYDFLPFQTKLLVTRLVHLFGHRGLVSLCEALHIDISEDILEVGGDESSLTSGIYPELLLNTDACTRILVKWVNKSLSDHSSVLLEVMQTHEKTQYGTVEQRIATVYCASENRYTQTDNQDEELTQYQSLNKLTERQENSSSDRSLSIDDNYFNYNSLERDALSLLKIISVEGICDMPV